MPAQPSRQERRLAEREAIGGSPSEVVAAKATFTARWGPLPSAEELERYDRIAPGFPMRLLTMVENQSAHRINIERLVITSQQMQSGRGQHWGLIIGLTGLVISGIAAILGHDAFGSIVGGGTVTGLVATFVYGKVKQSNDLAAKKPQ